MCTELLPPDGYPVAVKKYIIYHICLAETLLSRRGACRVLVGKHQGKRQIGRPKRRQENDIKTYLQKIGFRQRGLDRSVWGYRIEAGCCE
jgi:hypothetical protein